MSPAAPGAAAGTASQAVHVFSVKAMAAAVLSIATRASFSWRSPDLTARMGSDITTQSPLDIFGPYTSYVVGAVLVVVTVLILWAFQRGRSIELGPIKIGRERERRSRRLSPEKPRGRRDASARCWTHRRRAGL